MPNLLPWILFAAGLFYALGGVVLLRQMAMDALLDKALAAITLTRDRDEETATRLLTIGAWLTFASGLALMAQSRAALVIFGLNILAQAGYLIWAARHRPITNEMERRGRAATRNALIIYCGVFLLVMLMEQQGLWRTWLGTGVAGLAAETGVTALVTAAFVFLITHTPRKKLAQDVSYPDYPDDGEGADDGPVYDPSKPPACLRLQPEYQCWPLWDDASFSNIDPGTLGFSDALLARIVDWDALFQRGYLPDDPFNSTFASLEEERLWTDGASSVWDAILAEWDGQAVNNLSLLPYLSAHAHKDLSPLDSPGEDRLQAMAKECRLLEIRDILGQLDRLAQERAATASWDGDTQDDIARTQKFYAMVLARVAPHYRGDIAAGLASQEDETRRWVQLALDNQAG